MTIASAVAEATAQMRRDALADVAEVALRVAQHLGPMRARMFRDGKESEVATAIVVGIEARNSIDEIVATVAGIVAREGN